MTNCEHQNRSGIFVGAKACQVPAFLCDLLCEKFSVNILFNEDALAKRLHWEMLHWRLSDGEALIRRQIWNMAG